MDTHQIKFSINTNYCTDITYENKIIAATLMFFIHLSRGFMYIISFFYFRYKYNSFQKKYNYSQLKNVKEDILLANKEIDLCSKCSKKHDNWYVRKIKWNYNQMLEMFERKRKQEDMLLNDMVEGYEEISEYLTKEKINTDNEQMIITLLENELQNR